MSFFLTNLRRPAKKVLKKPNNQEKQNLIKEETKPAPVVEEEPVTEEPAPVVEEPSPVAEEPAPVVEEPAPVVEESKENTTSKKSKKNKKK